VRSTTDRLRRGAPLLIVLLIAACSGPSPSPSQPGPSEASASPAASAAEESAPAASASAGAGPGQPYDAADILEAMSTSPRPDGVAEELQTNAIAAAIAAEIWTFDGMPWDEMVVGGTCGAQTCVVEVSGSREGVEGDDAWTFAVDPATETVSVGATDLRALPGEVADELDTLARSLVVNEALETMELSNLAWLPPPGTDRFAMSYRSGGEEGSCGVDLVVDAAERSIVDEITIGDC
jgi:hypothetical protein